MYLYIIASRAQHARYLNYVGTFKSVITMKSFGLLFVICYVVTAILAASRPECFPISPACLQPHVDECRDALLKMRYTDPGYVTTFGRHLVWRRNTIDVPRVWHSHPKNCVVKLDVIAAGVTDSFRLQHLTTQGEQIIASCIQGGNKCGGIINVGPKRVMQLSVGYYSTILPPWVNEQHTTNISGIRLPGGGARDHSLERKAG